MSDVMLFGVLRMPYEMAMSSELSRRQFYERAQEAANRLEGLDAEKWMPIETAPRDGTPVDVWRGVWRERACNMVRVELSPENVFYAPVESGPSCVRDATHWMPLPHRQPTDAHRRWSDGRETEAVSVLRALNGK